MAPPAKRSRRNNPNEEKAVSDTPAKKAKTGKGNLNHFLRVYKGMSDWHIPIFEAVLKETNAQRVLYPGSDKHVTASLCFPDVVYLDFNRKLTPYFTDLHILEWINQNKKYAENPKIVYKCKNFESSFGETAGSFDLLVSASAGIVSKSCGKYVKKDGYFLASDAHFDARQAFISPQFKLLAVYDNSKQDLDFTPQGLEGHFKTTKGAMITEEQVKESIEKVKSKRSFKLEKEAMFYLFVKIK